MLNQSLTGKRIFIKACLLVSVVLLGGFLLSVPVRVQGQGANDPQAERDRAFRLLQAGKFIEAQPIFEKLVAMNPRDGEAQFGLGFTLVATSKSIKDEASRRRERLRARTAFLKAKELGYESDLVEAGLASILPDGGEALKFSTNAAADEAMQEGEAAYTRRDYDKAIEAYQRALKLDPKLYLAAVFLGDMYALKKQIDEAGRWYARAISINPDTETAYRYWSDVLLKNGRPDGARDQAIEAIIADPYNAIAYQGLTQWAQTQKISVGHPRIVPPNSTGTQGGATTLSIDPRSLGSNDGSSEWRLYNVTRAAWQKDDFFKNYPGEKVYRHSLREEAAALRMVAEACTRDLKAGRVKALEASLDSLVQLNDAGLLEAYILFAHPDKGIAQDYASYRLANRDKLRRYWLEVAIIR